jgi:hypothetical protein
MYIAVLCSVPNMTLLETGDTTEVETVLAVAGAVSGVRGRLIGAPVLCKTATSWVKPRRLSNQAGGWRCAYQTGNSSASKLV